jgi:EmrB/QacA subfamily drug resistance transporter
MADITQVTPDETAPSTEGQARLGWALALICIAQLMVVLDSTIANIALPFIQQDLEFTPANLAWVITAYALFFGGFLLLGGRLGDLYGRRRIFIIGLVVFAVASFLGGLAQNEAMILSSRGLQGLGAALASPAALALITTTFPAGPARSRAFGVYAAISGVGAAIGLILGGWLTGLDLSVFGADLHGWRLTFLINTPIGLGAALLAPRILEESDRHPGELDVPGAVTGTAGLLGIVYGLTRSATHGWDDSFTILSLVAGVAVFAAFLVIESRVAHPLLPFRVFQNRTRAVSFAAMMIVPAAMFSMFFYLSQYMQVVMDYGPLKTGVSFLPFPFSLVISAQIASRLMGKVDPRFLAGTGTLLAGFALLGFSRIPYDTEFPVTSVHASYATDIMPFIVMMAFGMGLVFVPVTMTAVHHLRPEEAGIGSGVLNAMQQVGGALGLSILSTVATHVFNNTQADLEAASSATPSTGAPSAEQLHVVGQQIFAHGSTVAFLVGSGMILTASAIIWLFLNVKHTELATDGPAEVVPDALPVVA